MVLHKGLCRQQIPVLRCNKTVVHVEHLTQIFGIFQIPLVHEFKALSDVVLIMGVAHGGAVVVFVAELIVCHNIAESGKPFQEHFTVTALLDFQTLVAVDLVGDNFDGCHFVSVDKKLQGVAFHPGGRGILREGGKVEVAETVGDEAAVVGFKPLSRVGMMGDDR